MRPATTAAATLLLTFAAACTQPPPPAAPGAPQAANRSGVNVGYLNCSAAGGVGFVFGSSRTLNCLFTRTDGIGERYEGTIRRFGVDIGFTRESTVVWMVFAPGSIAPGAPWPVSTPVLRRRAQWVSASALTCCSAAATIRSPCSRSASKAVSD